MIRHGWLPLVGLLAVSPLAHGQKKPLDAVENFVFYTVPYVESCIWMDDLMRKTCAYVQPLPPSRANPCQLPARPYRERVATNYAARVASVARRASAMPAIWVSRM